jgi:hypothetical protein
MVAHHDPAAVEYVLGRRRKREFVHVRRILAEALIPRHGSAPFLGIMLAIPPSLAAWAIIYIALN